ncbi:MAG TPA: ATP-binding cassette domain-containing protein [Cellulomonas sp.]
MPEPAVTTRGLRKTYHARGRRIVAVEALDLDVPAGGVHGFLGPNGSGKTTTIRMLLGLIRPDQGEMTVFGTPVPTQLPAVVGRIGAIVESPKFFASFSARRNLELLAQAIGVGRHQVTVVLGDVGLADRADSPVRTYSLGMRQRLAIAATLLKDPDLLIFDEPTNGLDPAGIREVRSTMRGLADRGKTVLVSSHILGEVQQIADTVSIVARGRLVAQGKMADLVAADGAAPVRVGVGDRDAASRLLRARGWTVSDEGSDLVVTGAGAGEVNEVLARGGLYAHALHTDHADLEQVFLDLTQTEPTAPTGRRAK